MARRRQDHLDAALLRELLDYDAATGLFTWRYRPNGSPQWNGKHAGKVASSLNKDGYVQIMLRLPGAKGRLYRGHRLAWLWMTGEWPDFDIDHENTQRADNGWLNLRPASNAQNLMNRGATKRNIVGLKGVGLHRATGRWRARIMLHSEEVHLGLFDSAEQAHAAYRVAAVKYHGQFARSS
jgi:hypothetical protein